MSEPVIRQAASSEIRRVASQLVQKRSEDPSFRRVVRNPLRRMIYRHVVTPGYLRRMANTWVVEDDTGQVGYAVVEQRGVSVHVADIDLAEGTDHGRLVQAILERAEQLALETDYRFVYTAPLDNSDAGLAPYRAAGYQLLDYYLWAYQGQVQNIAAPAAVRMQPLVLTKALQSRLDYLRLELDASHVAGRELVDAVFLPNRPPRQRAFEIELVPAAIGQPAETAGFLLPRPNERDDGVLTLVVSLRPEFWGSELEAQIIGGFASATKPGQPVPLRVLLSTTDHCLRADSQLAAMGLKRQLDRRPVLFKDLLVAQPLPAA